MNDLHYLALSAALCWLMVLTASLIRARGWTAPGLIVAFGNRDVLPDSTALSERAKRAGNNMIEALVIFTAAVAAARLAGATAAETTLGAAIFFWSRVAYWFIYLAGITYVRTLIWTVGVVGTVMVGIAAFR